MPEDKTNLCALCQKLAAQRCTACKLVSYCSKEHQKAHWKSHKAACRPFEVQNIAKLGRCLVATRDLAVGDLILTEEPIVYGPRPHVIEKGPVPCPGCCRLIYASRAPRCGGCDWPVCNTECDGLRDPRRHGYECFLIGLRAHRALDNLHDYYRQNVLLVVRCLLLQRHGGKKWSKLLEMESHFDKRKKGTQVYKEIDERVVQYLYQFIEKLKALEVATKSVVLSDVSAETIHKICGIIDVNALEINQDAELSALYPTAYLLEHSCVSNTIYTFDNVEKQYRITLRASVPIKKGDHITTMYTHALWGTQARREHLRETKYFSCECKRCADPTELGTYLSALRCMGTENQPCNGIQLPLDPLDDKTEWACDKCPVRVASADVAYLANQIGEEVDVIQVTNPSIKDLDGMLTKMATFLHPNHYHIYSIKHSLVQLYGYQQGYTASQITDELLKKKSKICRQLIETTEKIDPGNARLGLYSGVLYHELYLANMTFIKRKWDVGIKKDLVVLLREAQESLDKSKKALMYEISSSSGEKLLKLIETSFKEYDKWVTRYNIDITASY